MRYEIRLEGRLPRNWTDWIDEFACTLGAKGETVLTGSVPDQSALVGLLTAICHMNLTVVSVKRLREEP